MNAFSLPNLEREMASHSRILALESSMDRGAWWATVQLRHDRARMHAPFSRTTPNNAGRLGKLRGSCLEKERYPEPRQDVNTLQTF